MNKYAFDMIKNFEQCRLDAYQDSVGRWTIGWGHAENVVPGSTITQDEADALLQQDQQKVEDAINSFITVSLTDQQFGALVDFAYNLGAAALEGSTLLKMVNNGDFTDAANQFPAWDHAGGVVLSGLLRRRLAEKQLFLSN